MRANITATGILEIRAETDLERYALNRWTEHNLKLQELNGSNVLFYTEDQEYHRNAFALGYPKDLGSHLIIKYERGKGYAEGALLLDDNAIYHVEDGKMIVTYTKSDKNGKMVYINGEEWYEPS